MAINTDDLRKALTDATPLYALAGTVDLAAEKLGEVPQFVEKIRIEAPKRFESVRSTDPKDVQALVTKQAKDAKEKLTELLGSLDGDIKKVRDQAQELALQGVGRAAEAVVKTREGYEELAERGRGAVATWRGEAADQVEDLAVAIEPEPAPKQAGKSGAKPQTATGTKNQTTNGTKAETKATPRRSPGRPRRRSPSRSASRPPRRRSASRPRRRRRRAPRRPPSEDTGRTRRGEVSSLTFPRGPRFTGRAGHTSGARPVVRVRWGRMGGSRAAADRDDTTGERAV